MPRFARFTVLLVGLAAIAGGQVVPATVVCSPDWYPFTTPVGAALRTNHTLATIKVAFTGSRRFGLRFLDNQRDANVASRGQISYRLLSPAAPGGAWQYGVEVNDVVWVGEGLDPHAPHYLEVQTTQIPRLQPWHPPVLERFRDTLGVTGAFFDLAGFEASDDVQYLAFPAPFGQPLRVTILGDSLGDGVVPPTAAALARTPGLVFDPKGARACWPRKAVEWACAALPVATTPSIVNHSFRGWWGCRISFPIDGWTDIKQLNAAIPWIHPSFLSVLNRSHLGAPAFIFQPDLVLYTLGANDLLTLRPFTPLAYIQDIRDNIAAIRGAWPGVKILIASNHVWDVPGTSYYTDVRRFQEIAAELEGHPGDVDLHYVDIHDRLVASGVGYLEFHPPEWGHDLIAPIVGEEIRRLLEDETGTP